MNLPNKLTIFRVILIPFFVVFLLLDPSNQTYRYIADAIFIIASLTDMLDGKIARKYNLVTNFGKFMDPLADKLLVSAAMICLIATGQLAAWIVIVIISREFIISGFRLIASDNGIVIARKLLGQVQDRIPDAYDHCFDCQYPDAFLYGFRYDPYLCSTCAYHRIFDRLYRKE